ncbi:flagellar hook assembly protein FlgD [Salibacterium qingdaonense]|uniref:Flagellar basal-body rod modification protein FlgD n=1 Tax=Salibacterium qingdaonense TaxID=266892 RepID=A0A1I4PQ61_9BACI|nr:flagellar hook assembly protein FlgD [Salibacterium qingdaonense]SFM29898.1 flagellar basal-body rod modification protein FlgD [Salibacterium qingdaonense]
MANTIQDQYAMPTQTESLRTDKKNGSLGKNDFLEILMTQLQNQSPADPMKDKEFISQMAQFSSLEQMTNMTSAITDMAGAQQKGSLVQHSQLIGKTVTWQQTVKDENGVEQTEERVNEVTSVKQDASGTIRLLMDNDQWVDSEQMIQVDAASDEPEETGNNGQDSTGS